ncbi:MAG TPA: hypothetical protein VKU19_29350 [Bryobacteraceae bacterium]|nr:hypothetical protein [Bryobacteraceae bacterium]
MADMNVSGPAWNVLREIRANAGEAERRGKLSYEKWKALLEQGIVAAQGNPDLLDFMVSYARPGWSERLAKDQEAKAIESTAAKTPAPALETREPARDVESASEPLVEPPPPVTKLPKINWRKRFW